MEFLMSENDLWISEKKIAFLLLKYLKYLLMFMISNTNSDIKKIEFLISENPCHLKKNRISVVTKSFSDIRNSFFTSENDFFI